jgi:hypothetical protein
VYRILIAEKQGEAQNVLNIMMNIVGSGFARIRLGQVVEEAFCSVVWQQSLKPKAREIRYEKVRSKYVEVRSEWEDRTLMRENVLVRKGFPKLSAAGTDEYEKEVFFIAEPGQELFDCARVFRDEIDLFQVTVAKSHTLTAKVLKGLGDLAKVRLFMIRAAMTEGEYNDYLEGRLELYFSESQRVHCMKTYVRESKLKFYECIWCVHEECKKWSEDVATRACGFIKVGDNPATVPDPPKPLEFEGPECGEDSSGPN